MTCMNCNVSNHTECFHLRKEDAPETGVLFLCCCSKTDTAIIIGGEKGPGGRALKDGANVRDILSTGRKRAVEAAPIDSEAPCEWSGLLNAGGGVRPIVGCRENKQKHVHHGPDKNTLNNAVGTNLHRICSKCHNYWHTLNDPYYGDRPDGDTPFVPVDYEYEMHDPDTTATVEQQFNWELYWQTPKKNRKDVEDNV